MRLSICIPTYNRSNFLAQTVHNVFDSIRFSGVNDVEVLISDNASTDETQKIITELKNFYPQLKSRKNIENVRDENFFLAAKDALGEYVWVFGDDDLLEENAVAKVLEAIDRGYSHIVVNYSIWDKEMKNKLKPFRYKFSHDIELNDKNAVLEKFGVGLQFISATVCNRKLFLENCPSDYKDFHQFGNSFLLATYTSLAAYCSFKFFAAPLVRYRGYNSDITSVSKWYSIFIKGNSIFLEYLKQFQYRSHSIKIARKEIISQYLLQDVIHRKKTKQKGMLKYIPASFYAHTTFLFVALPVILLPGFLFKLLYKTVTYFHADRN